MASVSSVQSTNYLQQTREAERLQASQRTQQQQAEKEAPPPETRDANLGRNLDVTA